MGEADFAYDASAPLEPLPRRIVSLAPGLTLSLFELNLGSRLVAVTDRCTEPPAGVARLPRVGDPHAPDRARIVDLRPDLVLACADDNRVEDVRALKDAGLAVWYARVRTARDAVSLLWDIMKALDEASMVPRVRLIDRTLDYVEGAARNVKASAVFASVGPDPWRTFNKETYAHDLLRVCGGRNVFADREARFFSVTQAEVEAAQPGVVLLPGDATPDAVATIQALDIPAARSGRVHCVAGNLLTWPGTRLAQAMDVLPPLLMPSATTGNRALAAGQPERG